MTNHLVLRDGNPAFHVTWTANEVLAEFRAVKVGYTEDGVPFYNQKEWSALPRDSTNNPDEAEVYASGYVKWDGCSELTLGHHHFCGWPDYDQHAFLLKYVYQTAFELMDRDADPEVTPPSDKWTYRILC